MRSSGPAQLPTAGAVADTGKGADMDKPTIVPLCDCHGEPKYWNRDKRKTAGGFWACTVKNREYNRKRSRAQGRVPFGSPEYLEKLSAAKRGRKHPPDCGHCLATSGENNVWWSGDDVGYGGTHQRHRKALEGQPCAMLDESCKGPLHAALSHDTDPSRLRIDGRRIFYSVESDDYMMLCASHHRRYDQAHSRTVTMPGE